MKKTNKGFTLVELIIVIAVIGVLAAILIPVFSNVIEKANAKSAFSDAKNALSIYIADMSDGTGAEVVTDGSVFAVEKANKMWYFTYADNGLTQNEQVNTEPTMPNGSTAAASGADIIVENLPKNVTIYLAPVPTV